MQTTLLLYIVLLLIGILVGKKRLVGEQVFRSIEKLQTACLMLLLFAMGISLGMNDAILSSLATIGFKGILFGLSSIVFSIVFVHILGKFLKRGESR